jgi:hypothetical protein
VYEAVEVGGSDHEREEKGRAGATRLAAEAEVVASNSAATLPVRVADPPF